jgi:hypothetical protein
MGAFGDDQFGALLGREAPEIGEPLLRHQHLHVLADVGIGVRLDGSAAP